jgi:hypothetical protein
VWPSNENLAHIARISNDKHGYKGTVLLNVLLGT